MSMSRARLKKIMADHHFKLWICVIGIVLAVALAAATPPLGNKSIAGNLPRAAAVAAASASSPAESGLALAGGGRSQSSQPGRYIMQGTAAARVNTVSSAVQSPAPAASFPVSGHRLMCPPSDGDNSDFSGCSPLCRGYSGACGCDGRGAEAMCPLSD
jgi:hypothetical protein